MHGIAMVKNTSSYGPDVTTFSYTPGIEQNRTVCITFETHSNEGDEIYPSVEMKKYCM